MADEDLASQEAEGDVVEVDSTPQTDAPQADATPEPIANLARELGWTPREEWQGEPDRWKPADQFIRDGREIQQTTSRELKALREQMERLGSVTTQIVQDKVAERDAYWQSQFNQAVEEGDTERANKLLDQRPQAQPSPNGSPEFEQWKAKNTWFVTNPLAQAVAIDAAERVKHLPPAQQFEMAERAVKRDFPELFQTQTAAKQPPATQTAATRSAAPTNREKGFAEMPRESQQMALDYQTRLGVKKEDFARSYWADKEGVRR